MIKKKTVLVLGAGASHDYGFPLGAQLRLDILALPATEGTGQRFVKASSAHFLEFVQAFKNSRLFSIDAFLGVNPQYAEIGKQAIAFVIQDYEVKSMQAMQDAKITGWYDYLWNKLASGNSWEELSFENLAIVTFNYDRSLEAFLVDAISGTYGNNRDVEKKLRQLKIIHVYGHLGSVWPSDKGYLRYGATLEHHHQNSQMADQLQVIPEARDDAPTFAEARKLLTAARAICFLGFGFDSLNLRRLDAGESCKPVFHAPAYSSRAVAASCFGRTAAEARADANACGFEYGQIQPSGMPERFVDNKCLETLRETLILG